MSTSRDFHIAEMELAGALVQGDAAWLAERVQRLSVALVVAQRELRQTAMAIERAAGRSRRRRRRLVGDVYGDMFYDIELVSTADRLDDALALYGVVPPAGGA